MDSHQISKLDIDLSRSFRLGDWTVEPEQLRLRRGDEIRVMEAKTMDFLLLFAAHPERTLSRDEIFDGLWGDRFVEDSAIKHLVWQLRKDLDDDASQPRYIETIRRRGYRLKLAPRPLRGELAVRGAELSRSGVGSVDVWIHQLPPPPADFIGRRRELAELQEAMGGGGSRLAALTGMGGVGKTALALKLAEELTPRYPDAQIYLDLKGVSSEPLTVDHAMAHVVRSFRPEARLPAEPTALASLYRSVLHGQRALLVMDAAAGREQLEPLLPPSGCALLTTSRSSFALPGLSVTYLDVLASQDAVTLLRRIAPRTRQHAPKIARLCGGLPLAVRLAGGALAERRDLDPEEYARRLVQGRERVELVEASLALSLELLTSQLQRLWKALAVFPATFDAAAAAAVWKLDLETARRILGELVQCSLVEWSDGRYHLHDLARLFAHSRLPSTDRFRLEQRHAEHYLELLKEVDVLDLYLQGGDSAAHGLRRLDTEWMSLQAAQAWVRFHADDDPVLARLCRDYALAGRHSLFLRLPYLLFLTWLEAGLHAARNLDDRPAQAELLGRMGAIYLQHQPLCALVLHEQALSIAEPLDDRAVLSFNLFGLANAHTFLGNQDRSIELYEKSCAMARASGDRRMEGRCLGAQGAVYGVLGESRRAIDLLTRSLDVARETGDRYFECQVIRSLGWMRWLLGEPQQAIELLERSLTMARELRDRSLEATSLVQMSFAYTDLGEPRRSLEFSDRALGIVAEIGIPLLEGLAHEALGRAYRVRNEPRHVLETVYDFTLTHDVAFPQLEADLLILEGWAHAELEQPIRAKDALSRALAIARETRYRRQEAESSWELGLLFEAEGELRYAVELMQVRVDYEQAIGHPKAQDRVARVEEIRRRRKRARSTEEQKPTTEQVP